MEREGDLLGLPSMIADLIEGNLATNPARGRLLKGPVRRVTITATDLDTEVGLFIGDGKARIAAKGTERPHLWIFADSATLLDLPNAKLMAGLPSISDPIGRQVVGKMVRGRLKIKGMYRLGLLTRVQRLLSVA